MKIKTGKSAIWQNLKSKFKNYGFWMSLTGAIVIFLQAIGVGVNGEIAEQIVGSFCGILVVLGIISNPNSGKGFLDKSENSETNQIEEIENFNK